MQPAACLHRKTATSSRHFLRIAPTSGKSAASKRWTKVISRSKARLFWNCARKRTIQTPSLRQSCKDGREQGKIFQSALLAASLALVAPAFGFDTARIIPATGTIEFPFTPGHGAQSPIVGTVDAPRSHALGRAS